MLRAPPAAAALLQRSHGGGDLAATTATPEYEFPQAYAGAPQEIQPIPPPETTTSKPKPKPTTATTTPKPKPKPKPTTSSVTGIPIPLSTKTTPPPPPTSKTITTTSISIIPSSGADRDNQPISTGSSNNNTGLIIGVVLGVLAVVAMVIGLLFWKRKNRRRAEEVRKADLYQQQRMMMDNQRAFTGGGHNRGHDRRGLSFHGLMSSSRHGKQAVRDIQDPQPVGGRGYDRQMQPDWWAKKTPLEYHHQVPPLEVLKRMAERRQGHSTKETHFSDSAMTARNFVDSTEQRRHVPQESISMYSAQHQQQRAPSKNRLSPIRPISPIGSVFRNFTGPGLSPRSTRVHRSPQQQPGYTGHGNAPNPTPNQYYQPPPPLPPVPISSEQTGSLPSPGFYDFIPLDTETEQPMPVVHTTAGITPPPIPKATRPSMNLARGLILGFDQGPLTINQRLSTNVSKVAPMAATPPQLDMQWSNSHSKAPSKGIQLSPISSHNSDISSLSSMGAGVGPRMGGRRPRTKSKTSNMDASI